MTNRAQATDGAAAVPMLDLTRALEQTAGLSQGLIETFRRVLHSGQYILGPEVADFEAEAAAYCKTAFAVGTSSGTDALLLALMAHDIGPGDDVLCPAYTFFATAGAIARTGARPIFVDICPGCYAMHPQACARAVTPNTRAIVAVHLFGQLAAMAQLGALARRHQLIVIEDAAQALGAGAAEQPAGALGQAGCFSFFPSKNLGALGDAGLVITHDAQLAARLRTLRVHGGAPKYTHSLIGGNFRLDALQAALLRHKLPYLEAATTARIGHAAHYDALFAASGLTQTQRCMCADDLPAVPSAPMPPLGLPDMSRRRHIYNQYTLRVRHGRRDGLKEALRKQGIATEIYYPVPMHLQPCFAALGYDRGFLPHAEAAAAESLSLPIFAELRASELERVADAVIAACR